MTTVDGFWLPQNIRTRLLTAETHYDMQSMFQGRPCSGDESKGIKAHWPQLDTSHWVKLIEMLEENRQRVPTGAEYWERLQSALQGVSRRLANSEERLRKIALKTIPLYTGYSEAMIAFTLEALDLFALKGMPASLEQSPTWEAAGTWQPLKGLPGKIRFTPAKAIHQLRTAVPLGRGQSIFEKAPPTKQVLGYGAGNVPGTALMIAFLAMATAVVQRKAPLVIIKNSRHEPIFSSLVLEAIESQDPDLVASIAVLVWDYEDKNLQGKLMSTTDLVIAAASDQTIEQVQTDLQQASEKPGDISPASRRFHAHGHKVSFSVIGEEMLDPENLEPRSKLPMLEVVSLLAALDSVFWDQHGCLSSRVHFVECGDSSTAPAITYAEKLNQHLNTLADMLPRGAWPRQYLHDRFDRYKSLERGGEVEVLSQYDDDFLVAIDRRPPKAATFFTSVNDCQGRILMVRPVKYLLDVPQEYLRLIPRQNLQSLSVATGKPGKGISEYFLRFATQCSQRGVTAIRTVGRGAFPQLTHSWDGYIPLDLVAIRPAGYFTTIEFEEPFEEIINTFQLFMEKGAKPRI